MQRDTTRKLTQGWLPLDCESDLGVYNLSAETPTQSMEKMERIVAPSNVREAYRPQRSAHQAVDKAREHYRAGYHRVVDLDLEKFLEHST